MMVGDTVCACTHTELISVRNLSNAHCHPCAPAVMCKLYHVGKLYLILQVNIICPNIWTNFILIIWQRCFLELSCQQSPLNLKSVIILLPHTVDLSAPSEGCTPPSHSYLIISILKMHATCNNNAGFIAYLNNTDVYWDPLGPEIQRHQLFKMLYISHTTRLKNTTTKTHLSCS